MAKKRFHASASRGGTYPDKSKVYRDRDSDGVDRDRGGSAMAKGRYGKTDQGHGGYGVTKNTDSGMIHDDWGAPALLPQRVIDRDWPKAGNYMNYGEEDLFIGVQKQLNEDGQDMRREFKPGKY